MPFGGTKEIRTAIEQKDGQGRYNDDKNHNDQQGIWQRRTGNRPQVVGAFGDSVL